MSFFGDEESAEEEVSRPHDLRRPPPLDDDDSDSSADEESPEEEGNRPDEGHRPPDPPDDNRFEKLIEKVNRSDPKTWEVAFLGGATEDQLLRLAEGLERNLHVKKAHLSDIVNTPAVGRALAAVFRQNTAVDHVTFPKWTDNEVFAPIAESIRFDNNPQTAVKELNFFGSKLSGRPGGEILAGLLLNNETITDVCLYGNRLGPEGVTCLAEALGCNDGEDDPNHRRCAPLRKLNLSFCDVGDEGMIAICRSLRRENNPLRELDVSYSDVGERGTLELARSLPDIKGLRKLSTSWYEGGEHSLPVAKAMLRGLSGNRSLRSIHVEGYDERHYHGAGGAEELWGTGFEFYTARNRMNPIIKQQQRGQRQPQEQEQQQPVLLLHQGLWPFLLVWCKRQWNDDYDDYYDEDEDYDKDDYLTVVQYSLMFYVLTNKANDIFANNAGGGGSRGTNKRRPAASEATQRGDVVSLT